MVKGNGMIHLQDYASGSDGVSLCGRSDVTTMSHHEIKRGRISCSDCLREYSDPALEAGLAREFLFVFVMGLILFRIVTVY